MTGAHMDLGERFMCYLQVVIDATGVNESIQGRGQRARRPKTSNFNGPVVEEESEEDTKEERSEGKRKPTGVPESKEESGKEGW